MLRRHRIAARLSQEQLAERAQISVQAVSALERGARRSPRAETRALLIRALGLEGADVAEFVATARASVAARVRHDVARPERGAEGPARAHESRPAVATSFIGRERERDEIVRALATERCVSLWGTGGVGKTRLAIESLAPLAKTFDDGIAFVALAPVTDQESVVRAISAAYDLVDVDASVLLARLALRFAGRRTLLVLDNCEHVVEHVSRFAAAALVKLPDLSLLATSREPLRIDGEHVIRIDPLAVPAAETKDEDARSMAAVRLFLDRTAATAGGFAPAPGDLGGIARICRSLDGLPLAIELAAARTRSMSVRRIECALDERFSLLTRGNRSLDRRQRTLRDTIGWSYELLDVTRRVVFERLALLGGPFAMEHAVAIAADDTIDRWAVVDAVADLVDRALVTFASEREDDGRGQPYTMLESTRLYAIDLRDRERADPDSRGARRRFGAWLRDRALESHDAFVRHRELAWDGIDLSHVRAYLRFAIDADGDVPAAATIVGTLMHWWNELGLYGEGLRWVDAALAKMDQSDVHLRARITALVAKTVMLRSGSLPTEAAGPAFEAYESALRHQSDDPVDRRWLARAAFLASEGAALLGRYEEAETLIRSTIAIYCELGDALGRAHAVAQAAEVARHSGDLGRARDYYIESIGYYERDGPRRDAARAKSNMAEIDYALGNVAAAVEGARSSVAVLFESSSPYYIANALSNLATYLPDVGALAEAAEISMHATEAARKGGFPRLTARAFQSCATVGVMRGHDPADAAALFTYTIPRAGDSPGSYTEARRRQRLEALLRERLSSDAFAAAMARGVGLGDEEALRLARDALRA